MTTIRPKLRVDFLSPSNSEIKWKGQPKSRGEGSGLRGRGGCVCVRAEVGVCVYIPGSNVDALFF